MRVAKAPHPCILLLYDGIVWYYFWTGDIHRETEQVSHGNSRDPSGTIFAGERKNNEERDYVITLSFWVLAFSYVLCILSLPLNMYYGKHRQLLACLTIDKLYFVIVGTTIKMFWWSTETESSKGIFTSLT